MSGSRSRLPDLGMNESSCSALRESVDWTNFKSLVILASFLCIDVVVITGNIMVIMAVYYTSKLRSVTNLFIVSLAVADLMVGVAVLPLSAPWEVYKVSLNLNIPQMLFCSSVLIFFSFFNRRF